MENIILKISRYITGGSKPKYSSETI